MSSFLNLLKNSKSINGTNDFDKEAFKIGCEELEKGSQIFFNIACIGHERNNRVQQEYQKHLKEKYGNKLEVVFSQGVASHTWFFKLKVGV